jgi:hypothetical protein
VCLERNRFRKAQAQAIPPPCDLSYGSHVSTLNIHPGEHVVKKTGRR